MSYEESYGKAFPFDKMVSGMLDPEMIEDGGNGAHFFYLYINGHSAIFSP